ncbi:hypothetical protein KVR01_005744 [Diaporthe batatas]|uniref:uncharacterized protein n=1 Tax=Diaporthe batatas TaxID=748121 RepID=UPI001D03C662|nr:uncharacterized protein KVR01_005744 [Diaporthe batatas]KAG8163826.1 hypothetical protein KVR01_005744 [Diaporthe batatas]
MLVSRLISAAAAAARARAGARPGLRRALRRPAVSTPHPAGARRSYNTAGGYDYSQNPVPLIRPVIWAATAVGTIYFTCAAYDVWQDIKSFREEDRRGLTFDQLETEHARRWRRRTVSENIFTPGPIAAGSPSSVWDNLSGPSKIMAGMTLVNAGFVGLSKAPSTAAQGWWASLGHTPALPWYSNSQLFTSMFAHSGVFHLALNMMALLNFGPSMAAGPPISGSGSHFLAFYLSTGVVSSLGAQVAALVFKQSRYSFGIGASGAVLGVFSAWAMNHPDATVRVFPIPISFSARSLIEFDVVFEVLGVLGVWRALRLPIQFGHSVHLVGLGVGAAYVTYDKKAQVWATSRRAAFRSMKVVGLV